MEHFTHCGYELTPKNNLEKAVQEYLRSLDRILIDKKDLSQFKQDVLNNIVKLNREHHRCKPVEIRWWDGLTKGDWMISGFPRTTFIIYIVKKNYKP